MQIRIVTDQTTGAVSYIDTIEGTSESNFSDSLSSATAEVTDSNSTTSTSTLSTTALDPIFEEAASTYNIDVNLLRAVAKQESGFDTNAVSSSGAMGIMQLMPQTAESLGCQDAYDPYQNIMAGAKYLSELMSRYNNDTSLALAAYNAGSGNVDKYGGIPPFTETENYVSNVLSMYEEGVSIPVDKATAAIDNMTESEVENQLNQLLAEFNQHETYNEFQAALQEHMQQTLTGGSANLSDSQNAYMQLLADSRASIQAVIQSRTQEDI